MQLEAYFDDSSDPSRSHAFVVGGCVGTRDDWVSFATHWHDEILLPNGLTEKGLHWAELQAARSAPYRDWSAGHRNDVRSRALHLIGDVTRWGVAAALNVRAWKARLPEIAKRFGGRPPTPFAFCSLACLIYVQACRNGRGVPSSDFGAVLFEQGNKGRGWLEETIGLLRASAAFAGDIPAVAVGDRRVIRPLQAADVVAWHGFKTVSQDWALNEQRPRYRSTMAILLDHPYADYTLLRCSAEEIDEGTRGGPFWRLGSAGS